MFDKEKRVPTSKLARVSMFGRLAGRVATNIIADKVKRASSGQPFSLKDSLLQKKNIESLADKLSHLRGAAMKMGQLLSMDAGELLSPELSQLLDKLRSEAQPMPHKQLVGLLKDNWGENWVDNFSHFDLRPFAAASIGQVHIAYADNGEKLAVKVQYPGVAKAIVSDVDNVALLLKMSGLLPKELQIDHLLEEAKKQLLVETDYLQEASFISAYAQHLGENDYLIPEVDTQLTSSTILVMKFIDGQSIDAAYSAPQVVRDKIMSDFISLFLDELFTFKLMQTDPNFANYLFNAKTEKIALLDFGATREIPHKVSTGYQALISAAIDGDKVGMSAAAKQIGFFSDKISEEYLAQILDIFTLACEPLMVKGEYDFRSSDLASRVKNAGLSIQKQQDQWHTPPVDAIFVHRKLAGLYLLAAKLKAKVDVVALFSKFRLTT